MPKKNSTEKFIAGSPFMSQHSYGKAIDISKINGVPISDEWEQATAKACKHFNNVLGPGSDKAHGNHLHLDVVLVVLAGQETY